MTGPNSCPKCRRGFVEKDDDEMFCRNCGWRAYASAGPPKPKNSKTGRPSQDHEALERRLRERLAVVSAELPSLESIDHGPGDEERTHRLYRLKYERKEIYMQLQALAEVRTPSIQEDI